MVGVVSPVFVSISFRIECWKEKVPGCKGAAIRSATLLADWRALEAMLSGCMVGVMGSDASARSECHFCLVRGIGMSGGGYPPEIDCRPAQIDISRGSIESE